MIKTTQQGAQLGSLILLNQNQTYDAEKLLNIYNKTGNEGKKRRKTKGLFGLGCVERLGSGEVFASTARPHCRKIERYIYRHY